MPKNEPPVASTKKCCDRYTREYPTKQASIKKNICKYLFFETNAKHKNIANAETV